MGALPAELVEEILLRLSVKSLLRFKLVCKNWGGLIESRSFVDRHYIHECNQDRLVVNEGHFMEGQFVMEKERVWRSYYTVLLLHRVGPAMGIFFEVNLWGDMVLLNPATRRVKQIARLPRAARLLVHDLTFGFGLDPSSGDHKIVAFHERSGFACVYSSSGDYWKGVDIENVSYFSSLFRRVGRSPNSWTNEVFLNGVYYWMVASKGILAFDMITEKFREIGVPYEMLSATIGVYGDSICLLSFDQFWAMEEGGRWRRFWATTPTPEKAIWIPLMVWEEHVLFIDIFTRGLVSLHVPSLEYSALECQASSFFLSIAFGAAFLYKESLVSM